MATTILTQDILGSYVGWDVTDFVKAKAAEGAKQVTFRVSTPYEWRALSRFTSSESTTNPGKGPQMLIALDRPVSGIDGVSREMPAGISVNGRTLSNPLGEEVSVCSMQGVEMLRSNDVSVDLSALQAGVYVACAGTNRVKFAIR